MEALRTVKIADEFNVETGSTPSTQIPEYWNGGTIKWVTPKDLGELDHRYISNTERCITKEGLDNCSAKLVPSGSIIISTRAPIGYLAVLTESMAFNQGCKALVPKDPRKVESLFVYYYLQTKVKEMNRLGSGSTFKEISKQKVENLPITLPPITTQKTLATILGKADVAREKRQQASRLTEEFLRSAFLEMFGDPVSNPKGWVVKAVGELAEEGKNAIKAGPFGSSLKKESYVEKGYKIYGQEQVIRDDLTFGDYYISEGKFKDLEAYRVKAGDILISLVGTYGKISIVPTDFEPGIINPRLMKITLNQQIMLPVIFKHLMLSEGIKAVLDHTSHGGTMDIMNVGLMKALKVYVPPLALQKQFAALVEKVETLRAKQRESEKELDDLFHSLMQRAFRGELVGTPLCI